MAATASSGAPLAFTTSTTYDAQNRPTIEAILDGAFAFETPGQAAARFAESELAPLNESGGNAKGHNGFQGEASSVCMAEVA